MKESKPPSYQVLLVEDDDDICEPLGEMITAMGCGLLTAQNGQDALDLLDSLSTLPDLILLDLFMPVMNGFSFLEAIKGREKLRSIPVVVLSASTGQRLPLAAGVLQKPIEEAALLATIRQYCPLI